MWKREPGYFPETGDWEFFTVDAKAEKLLSLMSRIQIQEPIGKFNRDEIYVRHTDSEK